MKARDGAHFVGLYASFPIEKDNRRTTILRELLSLEKCLSFNEMKCGRIRGNIRKIAFTEQRLSNFMEVLTAGEADWLQLHTARTDGDWVRGDEESVQISWMSSITEPFQRPLSPIEKRFGQAGSVVVTYPTDRFSIDSESPFEQKLLQLMKRLFIEQQMSWAFVHQGFRPKYPYSIGEDDVFQETRGGFPLTSFDADLDIAIFFKEFVKGAFWANFLNEVHVKKLGGRDAILRELPSIVEDLGESRILLTVGASPIPKDQDAAVTDYQRLRRFLQPILLETPADRQKLQMEVLGSWKPPNLPERNKEWEEFLVSQRK